MTDQYGSAYTGAQIDEAVGDVRNNKDKWDKNSGLPRVTAADNGKFLRVVAGAWAAASVPNANGGAF